MNPESPWTSERDLTLEQALACVRQAHPELQAERAEEFGSGWDNFAIKVDTPRGPFVFRFPRRAVALDFLEQETRLLPALAPRLSVPVPRPLGWVSAPELYAWPFAGYPLLEGTTADRARCDSAERLGLAAPLGRFLRELHGLDPREFRVAPDTIRRLDLRYRIGFTEERWPRFCDLGLADASLLGRMVRELPDPDRWRAGARSVVHGDLYARHLLLDEHRQLCGVIDWGDVHAGDPAGDLALAATFLGAEARVSFFEEYGPVPAETWSVARFKGLIYLVALGLYGADIGDDDLMWECARWVEALEGA
ncbi:MAG: phosphotransferase [Planctomycetota bacterium]|jgi:aminoglycoside phosphotransferase (APT) family kinase protein